MKRGTVTSKGAHYRHILTCECCLNLFLATRSDARFCSKKCRQRAYRQRKKYERKRTRELCRKHNLPVPPTEWQLRKARIQTA